MVLEETVFVFAPERIVYSLYQLFMRSSTERMCILVPNLKDMLMYLSLQVVYSCVLIVWCNSNLGSSRWFECNNRARLWLGGYYCTHNHRLYINYFDLLIRCVPCCLVQHSVSDRQWSGRAG